mmetsp:Transcript_20107/g.43757  ORF Transcript_20107/g.43757 Transcript_20107/m.43757 type:complete len:488 (-) Transcript_20107:1101-2564(-)
MSFRIATSLLYFVASALAYEPTWESLDSRPLPQWYNDAKVGIFIHWGVFSVPSFGSEWFWKYWQSHQQDYDDFVTKTETPGFAYADYAHRFDAVFFDPDEWAETFAKSGAQYVVLTSKHHEGFCNWDSRKIGTTWNWNSMDVGPRRDLVGDLAAAIRKPGLKSPHTNKPLKFGVYHSLLEWFNPLYQQDLESDTTSQIFVDTKIMPELHQLVETYKPEVIWSDGDWTADSDYWKSKEFLAWLATNSSVKETVVWNDRWGIDTRCEHGSFWNCDDRYLSNTTLEHKWEYCMTIDKNSWGWNRKAKLSDYKTTEELITELVTTVSRNGNMLINVGPASDGTISPIFVDRLMGLGDWLKVNGRAIYNSRPWNICNQDTKNPNVYYTRDDTVLYAHLTQWPLDNKVVLGCPEVSKRTKINILGMKDAGAESELKIIDINSNDKKGLKGRFVGGGGALIQLPDMNPSQMPCEHVWVVAMTAVVNLDDTISPQ